MESYIVKNPLSNKQIAKIELKKLSQLRNIIDKSHNIFSQWSGLTAWQRAEILNKWADLIIKNKHNLAKTITAESGKLPEEAITEVEYSTSFITWSAEAAKRIYGEVIPMPNTNKGLVIKQPVGVVAAITPWNFPAAMITRKTAPALAVGCTVVLKPALETPLTAIELQKLAIKAGVPEDVFVVVSGKADEFGKEFCTNPKIKKISFTGSTKVGKILMQQAAQNITKLTLELGGNAPFIIFADADIDKAVSAAIKSRFRFSGQTCICANRFLIEEKIYNKFAQKLVSEVKKLKIAPLINKAAIEKIDKLVKTSNGKILCGGKYKNNYYEPTVICNIKPNAEIFNTEIFGPVATLYKFRTLSEALNLANSTNYGLAAYIFTSDIAKAWQLAENLEFGIIGINENHVATAHAPFGGIKQSGIGFEGSHFGLEEFLNIKYINMNIFN